MRAANNVIELVLCWPNSKWALHCGLTYYWHSWSAVSRGGDLTLTVLCIHTLCAAFGSGKALTNGGLPIYRALWDYIWCDADLFLVLCCVSSVFCLVCSL